MIVCTMSPIRQNPAFNPAFTRREITNTAYGKHNNTRPQKRTKA